MATPTKITDHVARGLNRVLAQFVGQPNFTAVLSSVLAQVQEAEDMLNDLISLRYLDDAVGAQLDGIGRIVGERRLGLGDTDYRAALRGRIASNRAHSRVEDIHAMFSVLLPGSLFVWIQGTTAEFIYTIAQALTPSDPSPAVLNAQLQRAKGGGIGASLIFAGVPLAERFTFAPGDVLVADAVRGYSNDAGTSGGTYSDTI